MENQPVNPKAPTGLVLNIQHFCTHDGPGIRTNVFLKGCSLRCKWCSNPESIHPKPELAYNPGKCIGEKQCGFCLKNVCPESAIYVVGSGDRADDKVRINWDLCTNCGKCVSVCPSQCALPVWTGDDRRPGARRGGAGQHLLPRIRRRHDGERRRVPASGRFPGGAPGRSPPARHQHGHRNGEQCAMGFHGKGPASCRYRAPRHQVDRSGAPQEVDGADNTRIRANLKRAYETFPDKKFIARTPLIPGVNDDEEHIRATLAFIKPYKNVVDYELLPYHRFGESKYEFLGRVYEMMDFHFADVRKPSSGCGRSSTRPLAAARHKRANHDGIAGIAVRKRKADCPWKRQNRLRPSSPGSA